ncbi:MAG: hypothetical protein EOO86_14565, partial [Pedobacter sp.]
MFFASRHCEAKAKSAVISTEAQRNGEIFERNLNTNGKDFSTAVEMTTDVTPRSRTNFNKDWKFYLGDEPGAKSPAFIDTKWRKLT